MEIPNLLPNQAEVVGNLETPDLDLASEVGASPVGLSPQPVGSDATVPREIVSEWSLIA